MSQEKTEEQKNKEVLIAAAEHLLHVLRLNERWEQADVLSGILNHGDLLSMEITTKRVGPRPPDIISELKTPMDTHVKIEYRWPAVASLLVLNIELLDKDRLRFDTSPLDEEKGGPTYFVTRKQMERIHHIACPEWKSKILKLVNTHFFAFNDKAILPPEIVKQMFDSATIFQGVNQKEVLREIFPNYKESRFPHLSLVWCWNREWTTGRYLRVWNAETDAPFALNGKNGGNSSYHNYEKYEGLVKSWMTEMINHCGPK